MRTLLKPTHGVLALLCVMYFITYIDRVNFATAAIDIQPEFGLNQHRARLHLLCLQLFLLLFSGDRRLDRRPFWPAQNLVCLWRGLGGRHYPHGIRRRHRLLLVPRQGDAGFRRRRHLSDGDARHAKLGGARQAWLRARTYAFLRPSRQCDHATRCRFPDDDRHLARLLRRARMREPDLGARLGLVFSRRSEGSSRHHSRGSRRSCRSRTGGRARRFPGGRSPSESGR